jgi:large subunit ribosomal protein L7A
MDTQDCIKAKNALHLQDLRHRRVVVGAKQLKKALRDGRACQVFLAQNADFALTEPIEAVCLTKQIHVAWVPTMAELGDACGIEVGAAAAAVVD